MWRDTGSMSYEDTYEFKYGFLKGQISATINSLRSRIAEISRNLGEIISELQVIEKEIEDE
jgi:hypothetical protein